MAQGRYLDRTVFEQRGDGAMIDPGGHGADACLTTEFHHPHRAVRGCGVDIFRGAAEQRVAHRTADPAQLLRPERSHQSGKILASRPVRFGQGFHRSVPSQASRSERL